MTLQRSDMKASGIHRIIVRAHGNIINVQDIAKEFKTGAKTCVIVHDGQILNAAIETQKMTGEQTGEITDTSRHSLYRIHAYR